MWNCRIAAEEAREAPGYCHHCQSGKCPVGITTQDDDLQTRLQVEEGARRLRNYLDVLTLELTTLAGTDWIPGNPKDDSSAR